MNDIEILRYAPHIDWDFENIDDYLLSCQQGEIDLSLYLRRCDLDATQVNMFVDLGCFALEWQEDIIVAKLVSTSIPHKFIY